MKLIVAGSTGFVATEIIRQALSNPTITSIVALGRRPTPPPSNLSSDVNLTKLKSVILKDFDTEYPADVKKELSGADACICMPREQATKISLDYPVRAVQTLSRLALGSGGQKPLRFILISGAMAEPDQTKKPKMLGKFCLLRGKGETHVLEAAKETNGAVNGLEKDTILNEDMVRIAQGK
ncbi:hypothetical protein N0V88_007083 [Collariella sp. IMI 366227]|nr:hypothetical protein N0V88_007083 [Collariella sp. IMI 366227]